MQSVVYDREGSTETFWMLRERNVNRFYRSSQRLHDSEYHCVRENESSDHVCDNLTVGNGRLKVFPLMQQKEARYYYNDTRNSPTYACTHMSRDVVVKDRLNSCGKQRERN